jgi:hypothetical protein
VWDPEPGAGGAKWQLVGKDRWQACRLEDHQATGRIRYAIAVGVNSSSASVGVSDGVHIEVAAHHEGTAWLAPWLAERKSAVGEVWLAPSGPAGAIVEDLELLGIPFHKATLQDQAAGLAALIEDVNDGKARHIGQDPLDKAVEGAATRQVTDVEVLSRAASSTDSAPLEAVMLARLAALVDAPKPVFAH